MKRFTIKNHGELVSARMNNLGDILIEPASKRFKQSVKDFSVNHYQSAYIMNDVDGWIKENVPPRHKRDLRNGWTVKFYMNDDVAWSLFGCEY